MTTTTKVVLGVLATLLVVGGFIALGLVSSAVGIHNTLNEKYQTVNGAKSSYSAALDIIPEKIKGVWAMSQQYLDHEGSTFKGVAAARSGLLSQLEAFKALEASGTASMSDLATQGGNVLTAMQGLQGAMMKGLPAAGAGGLAVNVQIEQYPLLRGAETTQQSMRTLEEGVNEIKTSLDDWIYTIKGYNTYRGYAWPSIICMATGNFWGKFPAKIEYFEGRRDRLDIDELNPAKKAE